MSVIVDSIEVDGMIDVNHHLILENEILPVDGPKKVKVLIISEEDKNTGTVYGLFKDYAKPGLAKEESVAWQSAAVKKHASS